ncbi:hypothetical protein Ancab_036966, partial [Ancistrocladus abbreviatus]
RSMVGDESSLVRCKKPSKASKKQTEYRFARDRRWVGRMPKRSSIRILSISWLFIAVKQKGGYNTVTDKGLWDKVGEDNGWVRVLDRLLD